MGVEDGGGSAPNGRNRTSTDGESNGDGRSPDGPVSRRGFLRAAAATGAVAAGVGTNVAGAAESVGIPTPWLQREGNLITDPQGQKVILRGVTMADPARLNSSRRYHVDAETVAERALDESSGWYNRVLRVPCQTGDVAGQYTDAVAPGEITRDQIESYVESHLRPVVDVCGEQGAYCIVDYHRDPSEKYVSGTTYTNPALDDEVTTFWEVVAAEFAEESHVLFELFSEPTAPYAGHDSNTGEVDVRDEAARQYWETWKETAQPWVDTVRQHAPRNVLIIGSPRRSRYTYWAAEDEFDGDNLGYSGHVYGHESVRPLAEYFGTPAEEVPVFMTEVGFDEDGPDRFDGTVSEEGAEFRDFFESHDVHWTAYAFDDRWEPAMFEGDQGEWTVLGGEGYHGKFFKEYLAEKRAADLPGDGEEPPETSLPPRVGDAESRPTDPDDDGDYEDLNGNERVDYNDVVRYYTHREDPVLTDNVEHFDYNGNERIDYNDVVELYRER